jgi:hypothetical protein
MDVHGQHLLHSLASVPIASPFRAIGLDKKAPVPPIEELVCSLPGPRQAKSGIGVPHDVSCRQMNNFAALQRSGPIYQGT